MGNGLKRASRAAKSTRVRVCTWPLAGTNQGLWCSNTAKFRVTSGPLDNSITDVCGTHERSAVARGAGTEVLV